MLYVKIVFVSLEIVSLIILIFLAASVFYNVRINIIFYKYEKSAMRGTMMSKK